MKKKNVYQGDIRKVTDYHEIGLGQALLFPEEDDSHPFISLITVKKYDSDLYKTGAVLIKTKSGDYVDVQEINTFWDCFKLFISNLDPSITWGEYMMPTTECIEENRRLFVDKDSLKPFFDEDSAEEKISVKALRLMVDKQSNQDSLQK